MPPCLVKIGAVDGAVAGCVASTVERNTSGASRSRNGLKEGKTVSSFFLMQFPDQAVTFSDCGVVPSPDARQLAEIAISAARSHRILTGQIPRVAFVVVFYFGERPNTKRSTKYARL